MTKTEIAIAFSNGEFDKTDDFIADDAVWEVVDEDILKGKSAIIEKCNQVVQYFKSVTTDFKTLNVISEDNKVVVNGTAEFIRDGKRVSFVSACDLYEFNDRSQIQKITSYCIQAK
ncbi:Ketosteroid isomerase-related protein [Daejeonella rubra]|uniref:Ketosteroid isomerase-related protein n=1 Tax=Daejeonella rubra TaxID=990371 RepID=A0A1G9T7Q6_9SPHI|nr:nuclear transport factor 2 family protein [Daejeonella rubra]SDM43677.1 Ketosteroid isomerase-related protein [Daejeonella rubra]